MLYQIIHIAFRVYYVLIFLRVLMSWIPMGNNSVSRFIYETTEPVLGLFRKLIPPRPSFPLDFSPILAFIVLELIESILLRLVLLI